MGAGCILEHFNITGQNRIPKPSRLLTELGEEAKFLAGGQSLIPLMKLRLSDARAIWSISTSSRTTSYIRSNGALRLGAMTRHAEIAASNDAARIPILHDCAAGIADPQVRNLGTIGGSIAEADPTGDWAPVLLATGRDGTHARPRRRAQYRNRRLHPGCLHHGACSPANS